MLANIITFIFYVVEHFFEDVYKNGDEKVMR